MQHTHRKREFLHLVGFMDPILHIGDTGLLTGLQIFRATAVTRCDPFNNSMLLRIERTARHGAPLTTSILYK
jgi:hypothetical protein